jgi:hypothetical protein
MPVLDEEEREEYLEEGEEMAGCLGGKALV